jgi:hypothetical protein
MISKEVNKIIQSIFYKPQPQFQIIIHSQRQYGQPKLIKPKELKSIKQSFSVDWIPKKCKCSCFIHNNDLYIQHRDFNSIEVYNSDHEFKKKFIYNDNFGCVVLRGEAWILVKDFLLDIKNDIFEVTLFQHLAEQVTGEIGCCEWERFFEKIIRETKKLNLT